MERGGGGRREGVGGAWKGGGGGRREGRKTREGERKGQYLSHRECHVECREQSKNV